MDTSAPETRRRIPSSTPAAAGMNPFGVAKLEQGVREPGWATVLALADALGARTDDFRPARKRKR